MTVCTADKRYDSLKRPSNEEQGKSVESESGPAPCGGAPSIRLTAVPGFPILVVSSLILLTSRARARLIGASSPLKTNL